MLCYELLVGRPPFESRNCEETYERISKIDIHFPSHVSAEARDLITKVSNKCSFLANITKMSLIRNITHICQFSLYTLLSCIFVQNLVEGETFPCIS